MTETPASGADETPPVDRRPRPQFGELAPEGWTWQPPAAPTADGAPPSTVPGPPIPPALVPEAAPTKRTVPGWDRVVTLSLLIFGLMATLVTIAMFIELPNTLQTMYTQQGLGTYEAAASVSSLLLVGQISAGVMWVLTSAASILLLVRGRRAFYVPLIGGVLSMIIMVAVMAAVLSTDATLLNVLGPA